ncbi:serine/threonine-protein kinase Rad53p [Trichomonascus vanleenenianus]|uniref:serine/threonine/tyrosine protein kinase RAD53 n=1 Tax=Trichomonascus vanleenenianus TaxID=2268995 RepID=UPI003EC9D0F9
MTQEEVEDTLDENALCVLVSIDGKYPGGKMILEREGNKNMWTFGRNPANDFCLGDSKRYSNRHFVIYRGEDDSDSLMIKDTSTNGTMLNFARLAKNKGVLLHSRDTIEVGKGVDADHLKFAVIMTKDQNQQQVGIHADYEMQGVLGSGAFATVKKALDRNTGKPYAIKIISKSRMTDTSAIQREIKILQSIKHKYVVTMHQVYEDSRSFYLVMDYVKGGDLMDFVLNYGPITELPAREIIRQVCCAVKHVHSNGISHRDLKPDNILIVQDSPIEIKVTDFGLAKLSAHKSVMKTFCGTLAYLAPEVMETKRSRDKKVFYSNKVDMWSIGCLTFVILTGYLPFDGATQDKLYTSVQSGQYNRYLLQDQGASASCLDFIDRLLQVRPEKRPSAEEALQHPWLREGLYIEEDEEMAGTAMSSESHSAEEKFRVMNLNTSSPLRDNMETITHDNKHKHVQVPGNEENIPELYMSPSSKAGEEVTRPATPQVHEAVTPKNNEEDGFNQPSFGVRDINDEPEPLYPEDTWMMLYTLGASLPCADICIRMDRTILGRQDADVALVNDMRISKHHCAIERVREEDGRYAVWFTDLSSNGCYVNNVRIGKHNKVQLSNGDKIDIFRNDTRDKDGKVVVEFMGYSTNFLAEQVKSRDGPVVVAKLTENEIRVRRLKNPDIFDTRAAVKVASPVSGKRRRELLSQEETRAAKKVSLMK